MRARRSWPAAVAATALLAVGSMVTAGPAASAAVYRFSVELGERCVNGRGPASGDLTVTLRSASGALLSQVQASTDGNGAWEGCFDEPVRSRQTIGATNGVTGRVWKIPRLTAFLDRGDDTAAGRGPRNASVRVKAYDCNTSLIGCSLRVSRLVPTNGTGAWATDLSSRLDARGNDRVVVIHTSAAGDRTVRFARFPAFGAVFPGGGIPVALNDGQVATVTKREFAGGPIVYSEDVVGPFEVLDPPFGLVTGNVLRASFESDAKMTIPGAVLTYSPIDDRIIGVCLPNRKALLLWGTMNGGPYQRTADEKGKVTLDLDVLGEPPIEPPTVVTMSCRTRAGDELSISLELTLEPPI